MVWIFLGLSVAEFAIAFIVGRGTFRNTPFILMPLVKAFYIVAEFMHLRQEVKSFIFTILIPLTFVVWLILALLLEGGWSADGAGWWG